MAARRAGAAYDPAMSVELSLDFWLELIGWAGSAVLVWSLAQARVLRFRVLNLIASVVLTGYNAALGVWPMVAMNAVIAGIDVFHINRLVRTRDDDRAYEVVEVGPDEEFLHYVLRSHAADIDRHNPGFGWDGAAPGGTAFLVLRDTETVGVVLIRAAQPDGTTGRVELDYVTPRFRDFSVGKFVYRKDGLLSRRGFHRLIAPIDRMVDARGYFTNVGFRAVRGNGDALVLDIAPPAH